MQHGQRAAGPSRRRPSLQCEPSTSVRSSGKIITTVSGWLLLVVLVSGCASTMSLEYSGISRELAKTKYIQIAKLEFTHEDLYRTDDIRVIFIAVFTPIVRNACPKCRIRWVSPDGELFRDEPAGVYNHRNNQFSAALPIYRNRASRLPGQWRVELYSTDAVIVGYDFVIEPQEQAASQ